MQQKLVIYAKNSYELIKKQIFVTSFITLN